MSEAPKEVQELFERYSENGIMDTDHLIRFLVEFQKEDKVTMEEAQAIIDNAHRELKHLPIFHRKALNLEAFFKYLFGDSNPPLSPSLGVFNFIFLGF